MSMVGKACGKFILLGEHFIVHGGVPALSFPLTSFATEVELAPLGKGPGVVYEGYVGGGGAPRKAVPYLNKAIERAFRHVEELVNIEPLVREGLVVRSTSNFPISRGFGSSASFALAFVRALSKYSSEVAVRIPEIVMSLEKLFHGNPSGVDAATILEESPIRFESGSVVRRLENRAVDFVLVDGGERKNCKELVEAISHRRHAYPSEWARMAQQMREAADACETALKDGNAEVVAQTVSVAQGILEGLHLSTPRIEQIVEQARASGALAGKVSGAGAGGAVVIVTRAGQGEQVASAMRGRGIEILAVEGVRS